MARTLPPYTQDKDGNKFTGPNDFAPDGHGGIYFTASGTPPGPDRRQGLLHRGGRNDRARRRATCTTPTASRYRRTARSCTSWRPNENRLLAVQASVRTRRCRIAQFFVNLDDLTHNVVHIYPDGVKIDSHGEIYIGQNARETHVPLAGVIFIVNAAGQAAASTDAAVAACRTSPSARTRRPCTSPPSIKSTSRPSSARSTRYRIANAGAGPRSARQPAAVDDEIRARHVGGAVAGEEHRGVGDVLRSAEPRPWRAPARVFEQRGIHRQPGWPVTILPGEMQLQTMRSAA